jgi:hypothetical protein
MSGPVEPVDEDLDVLDVAPSRLLHWTAWLGALVLVAAIGGYAWQQVTHDDAAAPRPTPSNSSTPPAAPPPAGGRLELGQEVAPELTDVADLGLGGDRLFMVRFGRLSEYDLVAHRVVADVPVRELADFQNGLHHRVVVDTANDRLWLVPEDGVAPADVIEFEAEHLRRVVSVRLDRSVQATAVLDGRLYLATSDGLQEVRSGTARARTVPGIEGSVGYVAADQARGRLLVMNAAFPTQLVAVRRDGTDRLVRSLRFGGGQVVVVRDAVWVAGYGERGAQLVRLDPDSLDIVQTAPLAARLGAGARFAAAGSRVVWVRSADANGTLWCMNAADGAVLQAFSMVSGPVVSQNGPAPPTQRVPLAFAASDGTARRLVLRGCSG